MAEPWSEHDTYLQLHTSQRTLTWLKARQNNVTSTQVHTILTGDHEAKLHLAALIKGTATKEAPDVNTSVHLQRGQNYEALARYHLIKKYNLRIEEIGLVALKSNPRIRGSPDGYIASKNWIVEIKIPNAIPSSLYQQSFTESFDPRQALPAAHYDQIMTVAGIMNADACLYHSWSIGDEESVTVVIPANREYWLQTILPGVTAFIAEYLDV